MEISLSLSRAEMPLSWRQDYSSISQLYSFFEAHRIFGFICLMSLTPLKAVPSRSLPNLVSRWRISCRHFWWTPRLTSTKRRFSKSQYTIVVQSMARATSQIFSNWWHFYVNLFSMLPSQLISFVSESPCFWRRLSRDCGSLEAFKLMNGIVWRAEIARMRLEGMSI